MGSDDRETGAGMRYEALYSTCRRASARLGWQKRWPESISLFGTTRVLASSSPSASSPNAIRAARSVTSTIGDFSSASFPPFPLIIFSILPLLFQEVVLLI